VELNNFEEPLWNYISLKHEMWNVVPCHKLWLIWLYCYVLGNLATVEIRIMYKNMY